MLSQIVFGTDNRQIRFLTDNMALVHIINQTSSRDTKIMVLVRRLVLNAMHYNIHVRANNIPGKRNVLANPSSRLQVHCFK